MSQMRRLGQLFDSFNTDQGTISFQGLDFLSFVDTTLFS